METVSQSTQDSLRRLKLAPVVTEDGEDVRIAGKTRSGAEFVFVLTRVPSPEGENTRVHLDWGEGADGRSKATITQILVDLERRPPVGAPSAKN